MFLQFHSSKISNAALSTIVPTSQLPLSQGQHEWTQRAIRHLASPVHLGRTWWAPSASRYETDQCVLLTSVQKRYTDGKRVYFCLGFFSRVQHLSLKQVMHSYCQHYLGSRKRNYKNFFKTMWSSYTKNIELSNVNDTATGHRQPLAKPTILYISLLLGAQIFLQCFFFSAADREASCGYLH